MIQAAMMFALGFSVCGLIALAASSALARRTRRLAERRVKQRFATKRLEFETERDELRARHAVTVQRLEQDVRKLGDEATAYRLESAMKDVEISTLNSDLDAKEEELDELSDRLEELREEMRESDRKLAETGTALRAARHALQLRSREEALGETSYALDYEKIAANDWNGATPHASANVAGDIEADDDAEPDSPAAVNIRKVATEIQRIANETEAEVRHLPLPEHARGRNFAAISSTAAPIDPRLSEVAPPGARLAADGGTSTTIEMHDPERREIPPAQSGKTDGHAAESRFIQAMEQIRSLKKKAIGGRNAAE
jgi:hypothetical protein